jgi:cell division protein FtsQ
MGRTVRPKIWRESLEAGPKGSQKLLMRVFVITLIPVCVAGVIFLFLSLYLFLCGAPFLSLKEIRIEGNNRIQKEEILAIAGLEDRPNLLTLDIKTLSRRLAKHPWIDEFMVRRVFPDSLRIVIREKNPVALIRLGGLYYMDTKGEVIDQAGGREKAIYPILTGIKREDLEGGERKAHMLLQNALQLLRITRRGTVLSYASLSQIHLDRAIGALAYTKDRRIELRMGFGDFRSKLQRLKRIWPLIRSMDVSVIDCSIPEKIIIRKTGKISMKPNKARTRQEKSK